MGRRRRRKEFRLPPRRLPKIFSCPNCGAQTVTVFLNKKSLNAVVKCGTCKIEWKTIAKSYEEKVDIYNKFVDLFMAGEITS